LLGLSALGCQKKGPVASGDTTTTVDVPLEMIHFDFDKYNIRSDAQSSLQNHAKWLQSNSNVNIVVEGNCDEWGTEEYNMALGERRAMAAKNYLSNLGVSPDRISTISYGESRPLDTAHNEAAWAKNRRDEFKGRK
jgi:peptidoglycan-associated lipoprotein